MIEDRVHRLLVTVDDIENAGGQPGLHEEVCEHQRHAWIAFRRLQDEGVAAGNGRGALPQRDHGREVEGCDAGNDAQGLAHGGKVDAWSGTLAVFALHQVWDAAGELHHLEPALDVALGVGDGLAMFAREAIGELVVVAVGELQELHEHAGAALRIGGGPFGLRCLGIFYRGGHLCPRGECDAGAQLARHWLKHVACPSAGALDLLAADEVAVLDHGASPGKRGALDISANTRSPGPASAASALGGRNGSKMARWALIWVEACLTVLSQHPEHIRGGRAWRPNAWR